MKKVTRLTEKDLHNIVKKCIVEAFDSLGQSTTFNAVSEGSELEKVLSDAYKSIYPFYKKIDDYIDSEEDPDYNACVLYEPLKKILEAIDEAQRTQCRDY